MEAAKAGEGRAPLGVSAPAEHVSCRPGRGSSVGSCWDKTEDIVCRGPLAPSDVADLRCKRHGDEERSATHSLICLYDGRLRGTLERLAGGPASNGRSRLNPAVPQQKEKQLLVFAAKSVRRRVAGPQSLDPSSGE
jgi:hypothetical protein